jgi:hypothetical protein
MATEKATEKATTTSDLGGANLKTDADQATADASVDDRKTSSATLSGGTKVTGPADVIKKLKGRSG